MKEFIMPTRIVASENIEKESLIFKEKSLQPALGDNECMNIRCGGYILLDFGREINGGIVLNIRETSKTPTTAKLRITFGESVMEALSVVGEKGACNNHSIRDTVVDVGYYIRYKYGTTGFRFVRLEAVDADIRIRAVRAEADIRELEYKGSFRCNDELLNKIWKTGAYTVHLNMHDYLWDGIKRDRLVWIGDMHPEVSTINAVFENDECVPRSLDFVKEGTPPDEWMNEIAAYSMWWIIIHYDWYMHWGDFEYLKKQKDYLTKLIEHTFEWVDRGFDGEGMTGFVDWSSKDTDSEIEGRKSITCMALECAAKLLEILDESEYAKKCNAYVKKIRSEKAEKEANKRMSALTVLSGRDSDFAERAIEGNSAEEMSCFMGYYILKAKAKLGDYKDALEIIREYWGGMLKMGATTFWEDFDIKWMENSAGIDEITPEGMNDIHGDFGKHCYTGFRHSLCHGWASGPTPFLMEQIGGIEILESGCRKIKVSPNLGDLEWIDITYPTPYGNIRIQSRNENGEVKTEITAPDEIEIV